MDYGVLVTIICSTLSAIGGVIGKTWSDRIKIAAEDRRADRELQVSEKDLWFKMGAMDQRIESLTKELHAARAESAELRVQLVVLQTKNEHLQTAHDELSRRYDLLRASHDNLLRGDPPLANLAAPLEGPAPGPSSVPEGDAA